MFQVQNKDGILFGDPMEYLHQAAQEAEFFHAGNDQKMLVVDTNSKEVMYESKGGPD